MKGFLTKEFLHIPVYGWIAGLGALVVGYLVFRKQGNATGGTLPINTTDTSTSAPTTYPYPTGSNAGNQIPPQALWKPIAGQIPNPPLPPNQVPILAPMDNWWNDNPQWTQWLNDHPTQSQQWAASQSQGPRLIGPPAIQTRGVTQSR